MNEVQNKITIFCEMDREKNILDDVSFELISKAAQLKTDAKILKDVDFVIEAVVLAREIDPESVKKAYKSGADRVVLIKINNYNPLNQMPYVKAFKDYYDQNPSKVILFPATDTGRQVAPRITTLLETGLVADCTQVEFILKDNNLKLAPTRPTFGSELMATILSKKTPECATIRPKTFKIELKEEAPEGEFVEFTPSLESIYRIQLLKTLPEDDKEESLDFSNAKIVLAAGYGLIEGKNNEYVEKLKKLAKMIGAKFASSRKLVDFNFADHSTQIGQTGSTVAAELYIAFGISGAIQHICGMKNSRTIIAINTDENAPIFLYSDYKIVSDAKKIIDELLEAFENKK